MANVWTIEAINGGSDYVAVDDSGNMVVTGSVTAAGLVLSAALDLNSTLDLDVALTGTGDAANIAATISHATQSAEALDVSIAQITNARTSGDVVAIKASITSLTGTTAGVDHVAYDAACTAGDADSDHIVLRQGANFGRTIDTSAAATGEVAWYLGANKADALSILDSTGDMVVFTTTTATPGIAETFARTGAGNAHAIASTWNSASATGVGLAVSASQLTTARTSGTLSGIKSTIVSLSGDTAGVDYYAYEAAVTAGEATADHFAFKVGAGFDKTIDASSCATTEGGVMVGANLASAWTFGTSALTYWTLKTTTATPGIDEAFTLTAAEDAHSLTTTANLGSGAISGFHSAIATATTVHTAGVISAYKASITSIAQDTGGDYCAMHIVSTDGGGTTPFHSGIYCDDPLDALIKVAADGDGGFVVGSTMTLSPESTAESGYFRVNIGATVYQVPIYAA